MTALRALLDPRSVAIVGATDASRQGRATYDNLRQQGYAGSIYLVNPRYRELFGEPCYPSVLAVPTPIDVLVSAVSANRSVDILAESAQAGARAAVIFADGFQESGPEGAQRQARIQAIAEASGMAICGPNCMGLLNVAGCLPLWMGKLNRPVPPGNIAAVAQSGTVGIALLNNDRGLRFSHLISSGNEAVTASAAFLEYLVEDPRVKILVNHLETLNDGHRYLRVLERAAELGKPVVILKSGRSEQGGRVIAGHTGRVAGSDLVARSVLRQYGAIVVDTLDELIETTYLVAHERRPRGERIGFVSISGGYSGLTADLAIQAGLTCPPTIERYPADDGASGAPLANFVDAWGNGDMARLPEVLDAFAQAPNVDTVAVVFHLTSDPLSGSAEFGRHMARVVAATAERYPKPIIWLTPSARSGERVAMQTLQEAGVPCLLGLQQGIAAIAQITRQGSGASISPDAHWSDTLPPSPSPHVLSERLSKEWLEAHGIPVPRRVLAGSEDDAVAAARTLGYPLVLKKQVRGVQHKTSRGYVRLGIYDEETVRSTYRDLICLDREVFPPSHAEGVLVEEQVMGGVELMLSLVMDATFGPIVYLGYGGLTSELNSQKATRLAPVGSDGVRSMLVEVGLLGLLERVWGERSPRVVGEIVDIVARLSSLGVADPDNAPVLVEINPLIIPLAYGRVVAADALVQLTSDYVKGGV